MLTRQNLLLFEADEATRKAERKWKASNAPEDKERYEGLLKRARPHPEGYDWEVAMRKLHWKHGGNGNYSTINHHRTVHNVFSSAHKTKEHAESFRAAAKALHPFARISDVHDDIYGAPRVLADLRWKHYREQGAK